MKHRKSADIYLLIILIQFLPVSDFGQDVQMNANGGTATITTSYAFASSAISSQAWCHVTTSVTAMVIKVDTNKTALPRTANISTYVISSDGTYNPYNLHVSQNEASLSGGGGGNPSPPSQPPPPTSITINGTSQVSKFMNDGVYSYSVVPNGTASNSISYFWYLDGDNPNSSQIILTDDNTSIVKLDFNNFPNDYMSDPHFRLKVVSSNGLSATFDIYYIL